MNKQWCEQKEKEAKEKQKKARAELISEIEQSSYPDDSVKKRLLDAINEEEYFLISIIMRLDSMHDEETKEAYEHWFHDVVQPLADAAARDPSFWMLEDSPEIEFDGDIIITDPCYFLSEEDEEENGAYRFDGDFSMIGIPHSMTRGTLYGDWSCTVINTDTKEKLGQFCADGASVSVVDLNELLAHNPSFDYHIEKPWTSTIIRDFKGTVQFVVVESPYEFEDKQCMDYEVEVIGRGINKKTGEPLNFRGFQTGF